MLRFSIIVVCILFTEANLHNDGFQRKFPGYFKFGAGTASYQIEGGWNADGKSENIWDHITHTRKGFVDENANGDLACDSYRLYKNDVKIIKDLGLDFYRFSLAWTRILPNGFNNKINQAGVDYYDNLIDELLENNITPMVTLYHWDLPQNFQELGGWSNPWMVNYFEDYARVVFELFGDRVKDWVTFNEPDIICLGGYGKDMIAPALEMAGVADYLCAHTVLLSHARAYHLYDEEFRPHQHGRISVTLSAHWHEPIDNSPENVDAALKTLEFGVGWYADPIFSKNGDYPEVMKKQISKRSHAQGFSRSRLPSFTEKEVKYIRGTYDFIGINHYTTRIAQKTMKDLGFAKPSFDDDLNVNITIDKSWGASGETDWLFHVPWGFTKMLNWVKTRYDNPEILILENGFSDSHGTLNDTRRVEYLRGYLNALLDAIDEGCNVTAYSVWSLMDTFEWRRGYTAKFGMYSVDFSSPKKTRTPKASAEYYSKVIKNRYLD